MNELDVEFTVIVRQSLHQSGVDNLVVDVDPGHLRVPVRYYYEHGAEDQHEYHYSVYVWKYLINKFLIAAIASLLDIFFTLLDE